MDALLKAALVGTSKFPPPPLNADDSLDRLLQQVPLDNPERRMLLQAGLQGVAGVAGMMSREVAALEAVLPESGIAPTAAMTTLLAQVLSPDTINLLPEYVDIMSQRGIHLPHAVLPTVLDFVQPQRRALLRPVLGERAKWLASFHPAWRWVDDDADSFDEKLSSLTEQWNEVSSAERLDVLRQVRQERPAIAREWLQDSVTKEKADQRRKQLEVLAVNLSADDLPFLESLLTDRSETVKELVRELLLRLPQSGFAERMLARAQTLLQGSRSSSGKLTLQITIPDEIPDEWERDGLVVPGNHRGTDDTLVMGLLAKVPPSIWTEHFACTPQELVDAVNKLPAREVVLTAIRQALQRFQQTEPTGSELVLQLWEQFIVTLAQQVRLTQDVSQVALELTRLTTPSHLEAIFTRFLRSHADPTELPFVQMLSSLPRPWTSDFSQLYLTFTRKLFQRGTDVQVMRWSETLFEAALGLNPQNIDGALSSWTLGPDSMGHVLRNRLERQLRNFGDVLKARAAFYREADSAAENSASVSKLPVKPLREGEAPAEPQTTTRDS